jgi:hypothetical protein
MADEFATPTGINWHGDVGVVQYGGGDKSLVVYFYNKPVNNPAKSREAGRPVSDNVTYVRMAPPGEKLNIVDRPAAGADARRFPTQWQQFMQQSEQIPEGTPIDLLYPENPAIGANLRSCGIHTIEACADLSAHAIENVGMGAQSWVNQAQKYIAASNKGVSVSKHRQDLEERDRELNFLRKQVEDMKQAIQVMKNERLVQADLALQTLVAGAMPRPTHQQSVQFDPQTAMINATSPQKLAQDRKPAKRSRPRVGG